MAVTVWTSPLGKQKKNTIYEKDVGPGLQILQDQRESVPSPSTLAGPESTLWSGLQSSGLCGQCKALVSNSVCPRSHEDRIFGSSSLWGHYGCRVLVSEVSMVTSGPGVYTVVTPEFTLGLCPSLQPPENRQTSLGLNLPTADSQNSRCNQGFESVWSLWCWVFSPLVPLAHSQDRITSLTHLIVNTKFHCSL